MLKLGNDKKNINNPIERWKEWQEHQFDPGYYTGGKQPPEVTDNAKPTWTGILCLICYTPCVFIMIYLIFFADVSFTGMSRTMGKGVTFLILGPISALGIIAGIRFILKGKRLKEQMKNKGKPRASRKIRVKSMPAKRTGRMKR